MFHTPQNAWLAACMHANDLTSAVLALVQTVFLYVFMQFYGRAQTDLHSSVNRVARLCAVFWSKRGNGRENECYRAGLWTEGRELVVDPAKAGNMLRYVNDIEGLGGRRAKNLEMVEFFDHETLRPHTFFFTAVLVCVGCELLLDYGQVCRCSRCANM